MQTVACPVFEMPLYCSMHNDVDSIVRENFERILSERNLKPVHLAEMINTTPQYISDIRRAVRSMGADIQNRICEKLKIRPWQFYIESDTPIVADQEEAVVLKEFRQAKQLGKADDVLRYERFVIAEAQGKYASGAEQNKQIMKKGESTKRKSAFDRFDQSTEEAKRRREGKKRRA